MYTLWLQIYSGHSGSSSSESCPANERLSADELAPLADDELLVLELELGLEGWPLTDADTGDAGDTSSLRATGWLSDDDRSR